MSDKITELSASDLGALLCSKVCHDIISPVGAITNGLELMDEDIDGSMRDMAMDLVRRSATQASAKLKFARIAFGAAGSAGAEIDTGDAEEVAQGYVVSEKPDLEWTITRQLLPKNQVKLTLNLVMLALGCIPQGGKITISQDEAAEKPSFKLVCSGPKARVPEESAQIARGEFEDGKVDAHNVQPYYCWLLAKLCDIRIDIVSDGDDVILTAG